MKHKTLAQGQAIYMEGKYGLQQTCFAKRGIIWYFDSNELFEAEITEKCKKYES